MVIVHHDEFLLVAENGVGNHDRVEQQGWVSRAPLLIHGSHRQVVDGHVDPAVHVAGLGVEVLLALAVLEPVSDVLVAEVAGHVGEGEG